MAPRPHTKEVPANPQAELNQHGALAKAIATAATEAAGTISSATYYKVDEIFIEVKPNPGPTTYKVTIKPASGSPLRSLLDRLLGR
jgi:hypothetical protein